MPLTQHGFFLVESDGTTRNSRVSLGNSYRRWSAHFKSHDAAERIPHRTPFPLHARLVQGGVDRVERSTCRGACKQTIAEGELRFGWSSGRAYSWFHLSCVKPHLFENAIAAHGSLGDISGVAENAATERMQTAQRNAVSARNAKEAAKAREKEEKEKAEAEAKAGARATKQAEKEARAAAKQTEKEARAAAKQTEKEAKAAAKQTEKDAKAAAKQTEKEAKAAAKQTEKEAKAAAKQTEKEAKAAVKVDARAAKTAAKAAAAKAAAAKAAPAAAGEGCRHRSTRRRGRGKRRRRRRHRRDREETDRRSHYPNRDSNQRHHRRAHEAHARGHQREEVRQGCEEADNPRVFGVREDTRSDGGGRGEGDPVRSDDARTPRGSRML